MVDHNKAERRSVERSLRQAELRRIKKVRTIDNVKLEWDLCQTWLVGMYLHDNEKKADDAVMDVLLHLEQGMLFFGPDTKALLSRHAKDL